MKTLGIVREGYSKWERRSPLTPLHVARAVREHNMRVIVQPSTLRVFTNDEYARAGAIISDDLSPCDCIVGVKQLEASSIMPNKSYLFFSHTIKAQESNMKLLDTINERKARLIDHECIRDPASGERLVAFGEYAGRAGMLESMRGLGIRLLGLGFSTPFLNVGPAYSYKSLEDATTAAVTACEDYAKGGGSDTFLPKDFGPLCFVFTGSGKVSRGAQEIFQMFPNMEMLSDVNELGARRHDKSKIYGICVRDVDVVRKNDAPAALVDRKDYFANPHAYNCNLFATKVLPHAHLVLTGAYWDARFPRWMPNTELVTKNSKNLLMVADVSCDVHGTFEGLSRSTTIEDPFYYSDFMNGMKEVSKESLKSGAGERNTNLKLVLGVDILPSELPRDASRHFGDCLMPFVSNLCEKDPGEILENATIAKDGALTSRYSYIGKIRAERERSIRAAKSIKSEEERNSKVVRLEGHLFDTKLINRVLDLVENKKGKFQILQASLSRPRGGGPGMEERSHTTVLLKVIGSGGDMVARDTKGEPSFTTDEIIVAIGRLVKEAPQEAEASFSPVDKDQAVLMSLDLQQLEKSKKETASWGSSCTSGLPRAKSALAARSESFPISSTENVTIFGAGMVSAPAIEYLIKHAGKNTLRSIKVVSGEAKELDYLKRRFSQDDKTLLPSNVELNFVESKFGVDGNDNQSAEVVSGHLKASSSMSHASSNCVLSLLPATMHLLVARACLKERIPLVTASYVGALRMLDDDAKSAKIPILCEMGLDPGMDHMSCAKLIDEGGGGDQVLSFESYCGGLPAPDCADNPLGYKLSWSPRGVLTALKNPAKFIQNNKVRDVKNILEASQSFNLSEFAFPSLNLELLPNRDSTQYAEPYGVPLRDIQTFFRGTLRYRGFSEVLLDFHQNGWLDDQMSASTLSGKTWRDCVDKSKFSTRSWAYLEPNLDKPVYPHGSRLDSLCELFKATLAMKPNDRDLVLMEHRLRFKDGRSATSTLIEFGNQKDSAMSRTVGITAAIGVELILEGKHPSGGIHIPSMKWVYLDALSRLEREGIRFQETIRKPE